jgi:acyl dehydratase
LTPSRDANASSDRKGTELSGPKKAEHEKFKGTKDLADAQIGDLIGEIEFVVTPEMVERFSWAMDDYNPWYLVDSPFGGRIAAPTVPLTFDGSMFYDYYKYPEGGSLFAKQEFEFLAPIKVGKKYRLRGTLIDTYPRKGRTFFKMGVSITNEEDIEVLRMVKTVATPVNPVPPPERGSK